MKKILLFVLFSLVIISCKKSETVLYDNESCAAIIAIFGKPREIYFEFREGKDTAINAVLVFQNISLGDQLNRLASHYKIIDPDESGDIPRLWINSSSWENLSKESNEAGELIRTVLKNGFSGNVFMYRKKGTKLERVIVSKTRDGNVVILFESLY